MQSRTCCLSGCSRRDSSVQVFGQRPEIIVQSVVEEECTGNGALACLERGYR